MLFVKLQPSRDGPCDKCRSNQDVADVSLSGRGEIAELRETFFCIAPAGEGKLCRECLMNEVRVRIGLLFDQMKGD